MHDLPPPPAKIFHCSFHLASIIKTPPKPEIDVAYKDLVCTEQDRSVIAEIIFTIAEQSKFSLLLKQSYMKNLGEQINHVYPLKFLAAGVSTPQLKASLTLIFDDYFKRNGFMDGLGPSLTREAEKGKLQKYISDFALEVGVAADDIQPFFQSRDWDGLVRFLISA